MYSIEYSERAIRELEDIVYWYKVRSSKAAIDFVKEYTRSVEILKANPLQFSPKYKKHREVILKTFPYSIVYRMKQADKLILITSVFHHKRKPTKKFNI